MTRIDKPECFNHINKGYFFDVGPAYLGIEIIGKAGHLHFVYKRFSHNILRWTKETVLPEVARFCKENGCRTMVVSKAVDSDIDKFKRFTGYLGFGSPQNIYIATQEI